MLTLNNHTILILYSIINHKKTFCYGIICSSHSPYLINIAISFTVNFTPNLDKAYNRLVLHHVIGSPIRFFNFSLKFFNRNRH